MDVMDYWKLLGWEIFLSSHPLALSHPPCDGCDGYVMDV
jgi:hypothetical protein